MKPTIICFYWQGDRWRPKNYNDGGKVNYLAQHAESVGTVSNGLAGKYVNNLFHGCKRFTKTPFDFICFTNETLKLDKNIEIRGFNPPSFHGVLPRLAMFSEASGLFGRQVLCLDVDIVITGSLDDLLSYSGDFCGRAKFKPGCEHLIDGDIMGFKAGPKNETRFFKRFVDNLDWAEELAKGRERYWIREVTSGMEYVDKWQDMFPGQIFSFKRHVRDRDLPEDARIVSFHGKPRPHQSKHPVVTQFWGVK